MAAGIGSYYVTVRIMKNYEFQNKISNEFKKKGKRKVKIWEFI